jgi:hypothetical protein
MEPLIVFGLEFRALPNGEASEAARLLQEYNSSGVVRVWDHGLMERTTLALAASGGYLRHTRYLDAVRAALRDPQIPLGYADWLTLAWVYNLTDQNSNPEISEALQFAVRLYEQRHAQDEPGYPAVLLVAGYHHLLRSQLGQAEAKLTEAVAHCRKNFGDADPRTATALVTLATVYRHRAEWSRAEPLARQAWEIRRKALGEHDPETLASLSELAMVLFEQGRVDQAEGLFQQIVAGTQHVGPGPYRGTSSRGWPGSISRAWRSAARTPRRSMSTGNEWQSCKVPSKTSPKAICG